MNPVEAMDFVLWEQEYDTTEELRILRLLDELDDMDEAWRDYFRS